MQMPWTAIADLAAREDKPLDGFGLFGLVKEVGVDDAGTHNISMNIFIHVCSTMHT